MSLVIKDRILETSTTTGTGNFTLAGAVLGFRTFASVCSTNDVFHYMIEAVDSSGVPSGDWETGLGIYSATNTLTRTVVIDSSNSGSAVSFGVGTKYVSISVTGGFLKGGTLDYIGHIQRITPVFNSTTLQTWGVAVTTSNATARTLAATNEFTKRIRTGMTVGATNTFGQIRADVGTVYMGVGDGFLFRVRFGVTTTVANSRLIAGIQNGWGGTTDPSAATSGSPFLAVAKDSADTNLQIMYNDNSGAVNKTSLGASFPANTSSADIYDVMFWSNTGSSSIGYRVANLISGASTAGTLTTDIPAAGTIGTMGLWCGTGATSGHSMDFFAMDYQQAFASGY
jgi:hypothetical protein